MLGNYLSRGVVVQDAFVLCPVHVNPGFVFFRTGVWPFAVLFNKPVNNGIFKFEVGKPGVGYGIVFNIGVDIKVAIDADLIFPWYLFSLVYN